MPSIITRPYTCIVSNSNRAMPTRTGSHAHPAWTNPLEEGSIHGVVYVWRHEGRPVVVGQLFSYLNGKGGRVYCHAMHSLAPRTRS